MAFSVIEKGLFRTVPDDDAMTDGAKGDEAIIIIKYLYENVGSVRTVFYCPSTM
jgi:hypothetical protein